MPLIMLPDAPFSVKALKDVARQMGQAILAQRSSCDAHFKDDHSLVTAADLAAQGIALATLPGIRDCPILSEENSAEANAGAMASPEFWIVDPLDGTSLFLNGSDEFAVLLAYVRDGVPLRGVAFFPAKDTMFFVGDDALAYRQQGEASAVRLRSEPAGAKATHSIARQPRRPLYPPLALSPERIAFYDSEGPMRYVDVLEGRADGAMCGLNTEGIGCGKYDCAAFDAIGRAAGIIMRDSEGEMIDYARIYDPLHPEKAPAHLLAQPALWQALGVETPHAMR